MSQTFTPIDKFDPAQPKSWASELALLDWDKSSIVFTKRTFIEFMKSVNVEVGPNFTEINKVPKYATFGRLSPPEASTSTAAAAAAEEAPAAESAPAPAAAAAAQPVEAAVEAPWGANAMRPSRKVRDPPGGKQSIRFGDYEEPSIIPPPRNTAAAAGTSQADLSEWEPKQPSPPAAARPAKHNPFERSEIPAYEAPRPSRRVRENPGGKSSMAALLSGGI